MFSKDGEKITPQNAETTIGPAVKVEGDLNAIGNVIIEGILNGSVKTDKDLSIGVKAEITANIKAQNAIISGNVKGRITIAQHIELTATANVEGDISTSTITIEEGAKINGKLVMPAENTSSNKTPEKTQKHD